MIHESLKTICAGVDLSRAEADGTMEQILSGGAADAQILELLAAFQIALWSGDWPLINFYAALRTLGATLG